MRLLLSTFLLHLKLSFVLLSGRSTEISLTPARIKATRSTSEGLILNIFAGDSKFCCDLKLFETTTNTYYRHALCGLVTSAHTNHEEAELRSRRATEAVAAAAAVEEPLGRLRVRRRGEKGQNKENKNKENKKQTTSAPATTGTADPSVRLASILLAAGETG